MRRSLWTTVLSGLKFLETDAITPNPTQLPSLAHLPSTGLYTPGQQLQCITLSNLFIIYTPCSFFFSESLLLSHDYFSFIEVAFLKLLKLLIVLFSNYQK